MRGSSGLCEVRSSTEGPQPPLPGSGRFSPGAVTHVAELHLPQLAQFADTAVRGFRLQEKLSQGHLLAAEQLPHGGAVPTAASEWRSGDKSTGGGREGPAGPPRLSAAPSRRPSSSHGVGAKPQPRQTEAPLGRVGPVPPRYLPQCPHRSDPHRLGHQLTGSDARLWRHQARLLATARLAGPQRKWRHRTSGSCAFCRTAALLTCLCAGRRAVTPRPSWPRREGAACPRVREAVAESSWGRGHSAGLEPRPAGTRCGAAPGWGQGSLQGRASLPLPAALGPAERRAQFVYPQHCSCQLIVQLPCGTCCPTGVSRIEQKTAQCTCCVLLPFVEPHTSKKTQSEAEWCQFLCGLSSAYRKIQRSKAIYRSITAPRNCAAKDGDESTCPYVSKSVGKEGYSLPPIGFPWYVSAAENGWNETSLNIGSYSLHFSLGRDCCVCSKPRMWHWMCSAEWLKPDSCSVGLCFSI